MSVFREKYRYKVLRFLGVMAVNTSELATTFKTNLKPVLQTKITLLLLCFVCLTVYWWLS